MFNMVSRLSQTFYRMLVCYGFFFWVCSLWACDVPVFRYALERWPADPYGVLIIEDYPLTEGEKEVLRDLETWGVAGEEALNIWVNKVTRESLLESRFKNINETHPKGKSNQMVLVFPHVTRVFEGLWSGPLTKASAQSLKASPFRQKLIDGVLEGHSAIFLYLEGGDAKKDLENQAVIKSGVQSLEQNFDLPKNVISRVSSATPDDPSNRLLTDVPFDLKFAFQNMPSQGGDDVLRSILRNLEPGHAENEPMAFAVFGRGRVLGPIVGRDFQKEVMLQIGGYLCGRCSCQVKAQNPGVDILLNINWNKKLFPREYR